MRALKVKPKTIKLPEENIGRKLYNLELHKDFLDLTSKAWSIKKKKREMTAYALQRHC